MRIPTGSRPIPTIAHLKYKTLAELALIDRKFIEETVYPPSIDPLKLLRIMEYATLDRACMPRACMHNCCMINLA